MSDRRTMPSARGVPNGAPSRPAAGRRHPGLAACVAALGLGAWIAVSAFHPFTPALPQPGLDASWVAAMGEAADRHLRWGVDVAFTYGPASPLVTTYFNAAYLTVTLPLLIATCLLFGACTALLAAAGEPARWALAGAVASTGLVAAFSNNYPDGVFLVLPLLPFLLRLAPRAGGPVPPAVAAATAVAVGMVGLAKMSFCLAALPLFVLGDAAAALRRRLPILTPCCVLGLLLGDLLYGQSLADLPAFIRQQGEVVAGYSEAMALDGNRRELVAYLLSVVALLAVTAASERGTTGGPGSPLAVPLGLGSVLLVVFKAGFVRQDTHTMIAWYGLALAATVVASARIRRGRPGWAAALALAAVAGTAMLASGRGTPRTAAPGPLEAAAAAAWRALVTGPASQVAAAGDLLRDPEAFAADQRGKKRERWTAIAEALPLPRLAGGVDVVPSMQSRVLASGLDYRPRPSFQEYSTYTLGLAAANRAFLAGPSAPDWILFGPESRFGTMTLDRRYPNFAEGALWLDLLRLYRPERRIGELVALRRRAAPAPLATDEVRRLVVGFDEPVTVGPAARRAGQATGMRATAVRIDVHRSLLGRIADLLFRPAPLVMTVAFADGHESQYQYVSGIGAAGFVLSPLVNNATDFQMLAAGAATPPDREATGFSLHAPPRLRALFAPGIDVEIRQVSGDAAAPPAGAASAWDALAAGEGLAPGATEISAPPPSSVSLPVAGLARVELGFGLAGDAPPGPGAVCFTVAAADGTARRLWRRCLDRGAAADRGPQGLSLALPPGLSEVVLETSCEPGCDDGPGAFWAPPRD